MTASFQVEAITRPRIGSTADANEDAAIARTFEVHGRVLVLIAVADGLGKCFNSALVSRMAVESIAEEVAARLASGDDAAQSLRMSVSAAHRKVLDFSPDGHAGTTATAVLVSLGECVVAHVGDSRAALLSADPYWCTTDHTVLAKKLGRNPTRIEAKTLPGGKRLRRTLGDLSFNDDWIEVVRVETTPDFPGALVCTDGVWTELDLPELVAECFATRALSAAETIVATALERDSSDDCSVAIALSRPFHQARA